MQTEINMPIPEFKAENGRMFYNGCGPSWSVMQGVDDVHAFLLGHLLNGT